MNILVVDDSLAMRLIVMKTLREAGYEGHDMASMRPDQKRLAWLVYNSFARDDLSSIHADEGRGQRDAYAATLDASWALEEHLTLSAGISTQGAPKQADNSGFRFPFFDFESEAENLTVFYVTATAMVDASDFSGE